MISGTGCIKHHKVSQLAWSRCVLLQSLFDIGAQAIWAYSSCQTPKRGYSVWHLMCLGNPLWPRLMMSWPSPVVTLDDVLAIPCVNTWMSWPSTVVTLDDVLAIHCVNIWMSWPSTVATLDGVLAIHCGDTWWCLGHPLWWHMMVSWPSPVSILGCLGHPLWWCLMMFWPSSVATLDGVLAIHCGDIWWCLGHPLCQYLDVLAIHCGDAWWCLGCPLWQHLMMSWPSPVVTLDDVLAIHCGKI